MKSRVAAAVLCGGRGERLRPLTDFFQKTMVPVGSKKRPLLEFIVRLLAYHGVTEVTLLTGYRTQEIRDYFEDGSRFGVHINYSEDQEGPKGSLNAVANALRNGSIAPCDVLLVYYGDVLSDLDVGALLATHSDRHADATLVLSNNYELPVGVADVRNGRVVSVREKPLLEMSVMTGCMTLGPKALALVKRLAGPKRTDLMGHFVPELIARNGSVAAFITKGIWYDVGTINNYEKLNAEVSEKDLPYLATAASPE